MHYHYHAPMVGPQPIVFPFGRTDRKFMAGPVRFAQPWMWTVCLATYIAVPAKVAYQIRDFSVPDDIDGFNLALERTIWALMRKKPVYVGCAGGMGRTGLYLACLRKALTPVETDPVAWVRKNYWPHAVETKEQERFVANWIPSPRLQLISLTAQVLAPAFNWRRGMFH